MTTINLLVGFVFLCVSIYMLVTASAMDYYTALGPGPGFFPIWISILLGSLSVLWLVRVAVGPREPLAEGILPTRHAAVRLGAVLIALVAYMFASEVLGFRLTMLLFLLFVLSVLGRVPMALTLPIAIVGSFGTYYVFHDLLGVHLPLASIAALEELGL